MEPDAIELLGDHAAGEDCPARDAFEAMPQERLEDEITQLAAQLAAAECRWLRLVGEFDRRESWGQWGCRSCAHWLSWQCGLALPPARERVRVANALPRLPAITAAFAQGRLSYSKVRALTRVARPANETELLEMGLAATAAQLELIVHAYRRGAAVDEPGAAQERHRRRLLRWYHDDDGMLIIQARLPAAEGAVVVQALQAAADSLDEPEPEPALTDHAPAGVSVDADHAPAGVSLDSGDVSAETSAPPGGADESLGARRADALVLLADTMLTNGPGERSGDERYQVVVHVDAATLADPDQGDRCALQDGPALAADTVRRLGCDATMTTLLHGRDGTPLDAGRRTRAISPALRRALRSRDGGCRFPGVHPAPSRRRPPHLPLGRRRAH